MVTITYDEMETAVIAIGSVLGSVCFALIIWVISLQVGLSSLRKKVEKNAREAEDHRDELSRRGYHEYQGPLPQPQQYNNINRPEFQRQTSAQASMYRPEALSRGPSMIGRGYQPNAGYDNSGFDRRPGSSYEGHGGVRVLPSGGGYNQQQDSSRYNDNVRAVGRFAGDFAKDVATDVAKDIAKDEAKNAVKGWFN